MDELLPEDLNWTMLLLWLYHLAPGASTPTPHRLYSSASAETLWVADITELSAESVSRPKT